MDIMEIVNQMLILFEILAVGYIAGKTKVMDGVSNQRITKLVMNITLPAMILISITGVKEDISGGMVAYVFLISGILYLILGVVAFFLPKLLQVKKADVGIFQFMMLFGNVGFMGLPVISVVFGKDKVFYGAIANILFNLIILTLGTVLISRGRSKEAFRPRHLLHTPLVVSFLALMMFLLRIRMPQVAESALNMLGDITTPASMLLLGSVLAQIPLKGLFSEWRIYPFAIIKMVVTPLLVWLLLRLIMPEDSVLIGIMVLLSAMPVATLATMLAIQYDGNMELASKGIFLTTVLSLVTIPFLMFLLFT